MTLLDDTRIKEVVRDRYGALARDASTATGDDCCQTDCCAVPTAEADAGIMPPSTTPPPPMGCLPRPSPPPPDAAIPNAIGTLQPGETVVDFGSGGGIDCFIAAKAVGETGRVIGIDMTEDMIRLATRQRRQARPRLRRIPPRRDGKHARWRTTPPTPSSPTVSSTLPPTRTPYSPRHSGFSSPEDA